MEPGFKVSGRIARPVGEVFEAVVNPQQLSQYFTTGGASARLEPGVTVMWDFADFPGAFPVEVVEVEQDKRIVFRWPANDGEGDRYQTTVTIEFEQLDDGRTWVLSKMWGTNTEPVLERLVALAPADGYGFEAASGA